MPVLVQNRRIAALAGYQWFFIFSSQSDYFVAVVFVRFSPARTTILTIALAVLFRNVGAAPLAFSGVLFQELVGSHLPPSVRKLDSLSIASATS